MNLPKSLTTYIIYQFFLIVKFKMKICAIICEFNPFHNGHAHLIKQAKRISGCDAILCIMSGSFTQRGEACVMDKFLRAKHALFCGADCVIELPVSFTVAPAEIFAEGAVKILSSIPEVTSIAFGCEFPETDFLGAAKILIDEPAPFKEVLCENLDRGESYIRSYQAAFEACGGTKDLLARPNNILAVEYAKAVLKSGAKISVLPIKRVGADYGEGTLKEGFSSAKAIRNNLKNPEVKNCVPECVYKDFDEFLTENGAFDELLRYKLLYSDTETLSRIFGCGEGLENRLLSLSHMSADKIVAEASNRRYSSSRIRRILLSNLLELYEDDCREFLESPLYIKPLAVRKERTDEILSSLAKSKFPVISRQRDMNALFTTAMKCYDCDIRAYNTWKLVAKKPISDFDYPEFI